MLRTALVVGVCLLLAVTRTNGAETDGHEAQNEDEMSRDRRLMVVHKITWPKGIMPYVIEPEVASYTGEYNRIMSFVEAHSCVRFVPWDNTTQDRYELGHPGHVVFYKGDGCHSYTVGVNRSPKGIRVSCCTHKNCLHEIGHALGFFHEQSNPKRDGWIRVNMQNVLDKKQSIYRVTHNKNANTSFPYDISTIMHYEDWMMSKGGPTFTKLFPELTVAYQYHYFFMEMADGYRCAEKSQCKGKVLGCQNDGYQTLVRGRCDCICPPGLDASDKCRTPLKKVTLNEWPKGSYGLPMPQTGCPSRGDFKTGFINYNGDGTNGHSNPYNLMGSVSGKAVQLYFCARTVKHDVFDIPEGEKFNWPNGNYCIYRKGGKCPKGFDEGTIHHSSTGFMTTSGETPDGLYTDKVDIKLCCSWRGFFEDPMAFPTDKPFALFKHPNDRKCQAVEGMRFTEETFTLSSSKPLKFDPLFLKWRKNYHKSIVPRVCHYTPLDMDCGGVITLSKSNPETTIQMAGNGRPNIRCTWVIKGDTPKGTLVLDFEEFALKMNGRSCQDPDKVEVRHSRIGQWGTDYKPRECDSKPKPFHSIRSILDKMMVRFYTIGNSKSSFKAKVRWIPDEDMCYSVEKRGANYDGKMNFTRSFLPCLPWAEMTHCLQHPFAQGNARDNLEGNACRNPDHSYRPWCYTDKEGCAREYCDVCGLEKPYDRVDYCTQLKAEGFCTRNASKAVHFCARTCMSDMPLVEPVKKFKYQKCGAPPTPRDAILVGKRKSSYALGESVQFSCRVLPTLVNSTCLTSGRWSEVGSGCLPCPYGEVFHNNLCLGIREDGVKVTYDQATAACVKRGGVMAAPRSDHEAALIRTAAGNVDFVWIDITDKKMEGTFRYKDGNKLVWKNWDTYEPNNKGSSGEDCAVMNQNKKWMDVSCGYRAGVVCASPPFGNPSCLDVLGGQCETLLADRPSLCLDFPSFANRYCPRSCGICSNNKDIYCPVVNPNPSVLTLTLDRTTISVGQYVNYECDRFKYKVKGHQSRACLPDGTLSGEPLECSDCPEGFQLLNNACHGILVGDTSLTFDNARWACKQLDGFMAMPRSRQENDLLVKLGQGRQVRLALSNRMSKGFVWDDGLEVGWSAWTRGFPLKASSNECAVLNTNKVWTTVSCDQKDDRFATVCSIPKGDDDLCYDTKDKGISYDGKVNYTQSFQPCLPWNKVTQCPHHSFKEGDEMDNLDGNYCRNPDDSYRPWCYTDTDGCLRNFCDVCGTSFLKDRVGNCATLQRQGVCVMEKDRALRDCLATCQKDLNIRPPRVVKFQDIRCRSPQPPGDGEVVGKVERQYRVGEIVEFKCRTAPWSVFTRCLTSGQWSETGMACLQTECVGQILGNTCYQLLDNAHPYLTGVALCADKGGVIAAPRSQREATFIRNLAKGKATFLGIDDQMVEGSWVYQDGTKLTWNNWNAAEPNDKGEDGEDCAIMDRYTGWLDVPCKFKYRVMCAIPRKELSQCRDYLPTKCPIQLAQTPNLCTGQETYARMFCSKTCGYCHN